jgi:hypothetical protein
MSSRMRIVVSGLIAQHPLLGGMTWHYLQYLIGLARLGHDVYYLEDSGMSPYNLDGGPTGDNWVERDCSQNVAYLNAALGPYGFGDRWAYRFAIDNSWHGLSDRRRADVIATADVLLNVSGSLVRPAEHRGRRGKLVYIDSDPAFTQAKMVAGVGQQALTPSERIEYGGFAERVSEHDVHFTFAEGDRSALPATGQRWRPTRQPIVVDEWQLAKSSEPPGPGRAFTTVMSWSSYRPVILGGRSLGQKDVEFRAFVDLPSRCPRANLEVALFPTRHVDWETGWRGATANGVDVKDFLCSHGWTVIDASVECAGIDRYRDYILASTAEWSVAKNGYVATQCGWFSERSGCYLAAGRPVVVQDTGIGGVLPVGEGLLTFSAVDEAADCVDAVLANYRGHSGAATGLAREYLDAELVLTALLADIFEPRAAGDPDRDVSTTWRG